MADATAPEQLLDPKLIESVGGLRLRARTLVEGAIAGLHRSALKGASVEFTEYKEYTPGDDIRHIDWRTFARSDRYYVKQYEDETNLRAYLVLDVSGSMDYGFEDNIPKNEYARTLAAALAYSLVRQGDAAGLLTFAGKPGEFLPASAKQSHLDDLFKVLLTRRPRGKTNLRKALSQIAERGKRRSLVFVLTDMLDTAPEAMNMAKVLRQRKSEVVLFHIVDPAEISLPFEGLTLFEGLEGDGELLVDPDDIRDRYTEEITGYFKAVEEDCRESDISYWRVLTTTPLVDLLQRFFFSRLVKKGRGRQR